MDTTITYEQAKEAHSRGEKVEMKWRLAKSQPWESVNMSHIHEVICGTADEKYEFRLADPYAELKAAHKAGKVIQARVSPYGWVDVESPYWESGSPESFRVKPDELKIEAGKDYRNGLGEKVEVISTISKSLTEFPVIGEVNCKGGGIITRYYRRDGSSGDSRFTLIAPWTDTPAPYDNWQHVPAWANWQALDSCGEWRWYTDKPGMTNTITGWATINGWSHVVIDGFTPTNFSGTWEQSLQERPKI